MDDPKTVKTDRSKMEKSEMKVLIRFSALLKEPGDFLVRATDSRNMPEIVISVLNDKRELVNLTIKCDNNRLWTLGVLRKSSKHVPRFPQVADLINYYKNHKLPGHAKLIHGITRPTWLIKHEYVSFDKDKDLLGRGNFCNVYKGIYTRPHDEKIVVAVKLVTNRLEQIGGDLQSHLKKQQQAIEVGERIVYTLEYAALPRELQAARGMRYLHKKNCVHRDLAARNCLISAKGGIKIADFGLSKLVNDLEKTDKEEVDKDEPSPQIPLRWMAPESLKRPMKFSTKTDVWSFAVMMYEVFNCGVKPWPDDPPKKIATAIRKCNMPSMPEGTPEELKELTAQIWVVDSALRPTMAQLCSSLYAAMKKYRPPPPEKFTLNTINGVQRAQIDGVITMEETAENEDEEGPIKPSSFGERMSSEKNSFPTYQNLPMIASEQERCYKEEYYDICLLPFTPTQTYIERVREIVVNDASSL
ncbi:unnamed protein product [Angiostrongylus costaricensis]|uniref:non-specific protein-tyrosine kinase n=1 Tax=Angiostrongylus costaricensis TaxID=334426 RepID=A0A158PKI6_ANGCS|nr:unnamed protein product [Angiostrongylus costaricensis]